MHDHGQARFFVTISARREGDLRKLQVHGLDLFSPTARRKKGRSARPFAIEGLLDEAQMARLRAAGYEVTVDAPMEARAVQPGDTLEFSAWLEAVRSRIARDGSVK